MRSLLLLALPLLPSPAVAAEPAAPATLPTLAVYAYPEDAGAVQMSGHVADLTVRKAMASGWRAGVDSRLGELLDRSPDDLVRAADALAAGRAALQDGLDQHARLRLEQAQEALLRARGAFLEAAAAPSYPELRTLHLYLGIVAMNLGQAEAADGQFREAAFLSPSAVLSPTQFPPSVLEAYVESRKKIGSGARGALKVESDVRGALILLDGVVRGSAPRVLPDVPEGGHYLEVRAPGTAPSLQEIQVAPNVETPVVVNLKSTAAPLRQLWGEPRGELAASALARILQVDRVALIAARTTVTGVAPFALRGATFEGEGRRRVASAEVSTARDPPTTELRLGSFAGELVRRAHSGPATNGPSLPAVTAFRERFLAPQQTLLTVELGGAYQDHVFDAQGNSAAGTSMDDPNNNWLGFDSYFEERTVLHLRYGFREQITGVADIPYYYKSVHFLENNNPRQETTHTGNGLGDIQVGFDARIPRFEGEALKLAWLSVRATLPTGNSGTSGTLRQYDDLVMGSGQVSLYAGLGGMVASDSLRGELELGYNFRLPDNVDYLGGGGQQYLSIGDEQHLQGEGALQVGRWLTPGLFFHFTHRDPTKNIEDPVSFDGNAREMLLLELGLELKAEFSEQADGGVAFQYPVWGKITGTFFPMEVTGPRGWVYYGYRF